MGKLAGVSQHTPMDFKIERREKGGITIFDADGKLVAGEACGHLREALKAFADSGGKNAILHLDKVDYIDSTGLGSMVICFTTLQKVGGKLKLLNLTKRNMELMVLTKLTTIFEVFNDESDAINSFFPGRKVNKFDILAFVKQQRENR